MNTITCFHNSIHVLYRPTPKLQQPMNTKTHPKNVCIKPGSQYDACASIALWASGWRWNRLNFYSSVVSRVLASVQPIRLLKKLTSGMQFDRWKILFSVTVTTLAAPASYCEPGFIQCYSTLQCYPTVLCYILRYNKDHFVLPHKPPWIQQLGEPTNSE